MTVHRKHLQQVHFDGMSKGCLRLSEADVDRVLCPDMAREAVRDALICHSKGNCVQPLKQYTRPGGRAAEYEHGRFISMPAYVGSPIDAAGMKWIAGFQRNIELNRPRASARLLLNSVVTGEVISEMECAVLSARRTAAVAALCVEQLAVDKPLTVSLLGAGPINHAVLEALLAAGSSIRRIRVFDPKRARVDQMRAGFSGFELPALTASRSAECCVRNSDVVIAATSGAKSYLEKDWISSGTLLVMLSLDDPTPELFLSADKVLTDDFDQCNREQKLINKLVIDGLYSRRQVYADLGEILAGDKPGREHEGEVILVNPMGMAVEDVAVGKATYMAAKQQGVGEYHEYQCGEDVPPGFLFCPKMTAAQLQ